ncbi:MAG: DUF3800 domain-containing protein [Phycisphaerae bacterium]
MKFCYCDESGTGNEPFAVMVGIITDHTRMHVTKAHWESLLADVSEAVRNPISEIHARELYPGNAAWRDVKGHLRSELIEEIIRWIGEVRKHAIVVAGADRAAFAAAKGDNKVPSEVATVWQFLAAHILLSVQRAHQAIPKNKGHTVFIFDRHVRDEVQLASFVKNPPAWTKSYYQKKGKPAAFNQVVDVPYFGDSREVILLQVADLVAYLLRKYTEIKSGKAQERYSGELTTITGWLERLRSSVISYGCIYPKKGRCTTASLFRDLAPPPLRELYA